MDVQITQLYILYVALKFIEKIKIEKRKVYLHGHSEND